MFSVPENPAPECSPYGSPRGSPEGVRPDHPRGGRPRLPRERRRTRRIGVNVSEVEYAAIQTRAEAAGMSPAVFLREAGLGTRIGPKVNDCLYHALSRIGVNAGQLARVANQTGRLPEAERLDALRAAVLEVRRHF